MGIIKNILKLVLKENTIVEKQKISEAAYKIRVQSDSIKDAEFVAGYFLRIGIGLTEESVTMQDFVRSYSVWHIDKINGTLDLAIATHSKGPGANWIEERKVGDKVYFTWKKGNFILDDSADSYLFIGDLSALSHLYMIRRDLPKNKQVESILYSQQINELFADIDGTTPFKFYELHQNPTEEIINKVEKIVPKMTGRRIVYVGGDSRVCVALNQYFRRELNWEMKQIKTKPFWNPDKKGLE